MHKTIFAALFALLTLTIGNVNSLGDVLMLLGAVGAAGWFAIWVSAKLDI